MSEEENSSWRRRGVFFVLTDSNWNSLYVRRRSRLKVVAHTYWMVLMLIHILISTRSQTVVWLLLRLRMSPIRQWKMKILSPLYWTSVSRAFRPAREIGKNNWPRCSMAGKQSNRGRKDSSQVKVNFCVLLEIMTARGVYIYSFTVTPSPSASLLGRTFCLDGAPAHKNRELQSGACTRCRRE